MMMVAGRRDHHAAHDAVAPADLGDGGLPAGRDSECVLEESASTACDIRP